MHRKGKNLDEEIMRLYNHLNYCEHLINENPFSACMCLAEVSFTSMEAILSYEGWIKMKGREFPRRIKAIKSRTKWLQERAYQTYLD